VPQLLLIIVGGLLVGGSLGLLGGGGTILTLPLLLLLGLEPKPAIAMSLAVVAATAASAAVAHARAGNVDWRAAALFAPATALGGYAGGRAAAWVAGEHLVRIVPALMIAVAVAMLRRPAVRPGAGAAAPPASLTLALLGAAVGAITGLVGAGGGFLFVPAFALLAGLSMQRAVGTSLVVIAVNAGAALVGQLGHEEIRLDLVTALTASAVVGAWGGTRLAGRASELQLRRGFGVLVLLVACWMLARSPVVRGWLGG